jgi:hypothetical protein
MPVLLHARCANCHGATDPFNGSNHPGSPVARSVEQPGRGCAGCHDEATVLEEATGRSASSAPVELDSDWRLPGPEHAFVGKDARTICLQFRDAFPGLPADPSDFYQHLEHDHRIALAFEGNRGISGKQLARAHPSDPPPLSQVQFLAALRAWVEQGHADCGPAS